MFKDYSQRGATMLEVMAVMMVITMLGIASIKLIGNLFDMFRLQMVGTEIQEIQKAVSARFSVEGEYSALVSMSPQQMVDEKLVPNQMFVNNNFYHRLGGLVEVKPSALGDEYYSVSFADLSKKACLNVTQINWITNETSNLVEVSINEGVFVLPIGSVRPTDDDALPLTVAKAAKFCKDGSTVVWHFQ